MDTAKHFVPISMSLVLVSCGVLKALSFRSASCKYRRMSTFLSMPFLRLPLAIMGIVVCVSNSSLFLNGLFSGLCSLLLHALACVAVSSTSVVATVHRVRNFDGSAGGSSWKKQLHASAGKHAPRSVSSCLFGTCIPHYHNGFPTCKFLGAVMDGMFHVHGAELAINTSMTSPGQTTVDWSTLFTQCGVCQVL